MSLCPITPSISRKGALCVVEKHFWGRKKREGKLGKFPSFGHYALHLHPVYIEDAFLPKTAMIPATVTQLPDAETFPLSENWFSNFNNLARTSGNDLEAPARRPVLSPSTSRSIPSLPSTWSQQLLDAFVSVHKNGETGSELFWARAKSPFSRLASPQLRSF